MGIVNYDWRIGLKERCKNKEEIRHNPYERRKHKERRNTKEKRRKQKDERRHTKYEIRKNKYEINTKDDSRTTNEERSNTKQKTAVITRCRVYRTYIETLYCSDIRCYCDNVLIRNN